MIHLSCAVAVVVAMTVAPITPPAVAPDVPPQRTINVLLLELFVYEQKPSPCTPLLPPMLPPGTRKPPKFVSSTVQVTRALPAVVTMSGVAANSVSTYVLLVGFSPAVGGPERVSNPVIVPPARGTAVARAVLTCDAV